MSYRALITMEDFGQDLSICINRAHELGLDCEWKPLAFGYHDEEGLIKISKGYQAVIAGGELWTGRVMQEVAKDLKVISRAGIGFDKVDIKEAARQGIVVTNTPGAFARAVAENALALILATLRRIVSYDREIRNGIWKATLCYELSEKTVGLVAFGAIAQCLAKMLEPFHVRLLTYDPFANAERVKELGVELTDLKTLCRESDIISIHTPLNDQTRNMFNKDLFSIMKDGTVLINTARGGIVCEADMIEALKTGRLAAAGLDTTAVEPIEKGNELLLMDQVIMNPHSSAVTQEGLVFAVNMAIDNALEVLTGKAVRHQVN